jgi:anaerobic selenocysteine-containing dehydrogenase
LEDQPMTGEPTPAEEKVHYRACSLCEAICGLEIRVAGGAIRSIRGDKADPFSRGHICPKAVALKDIHDDPDRLRQPMRRTASGFAPVPWPEALDEAADALRKIRGRYGRKAVAVYAGNPNVHNWGSILFAPPFYRSLRAGRRYSATSVDQLPHHLAAYLMFGHQFLLPVPDLDRTDFLLIFGANPVVSNGSIMTAPDIKKRLKAIRERGGRIVVVDPRRTETTGFADEHLFVRPGSDALLLAALVQIVLTEHPDRLGGLADLVDGVDELAAALAPYTPEAVSGATGVPAESVRRLADDFCGAKSAVAYGRMGVSVQAFGGLCQWLVNVLNLVTGNMDRAGGAMFPRPAVDLLSLSSRGGFARFKSSVRGLPEFAGELPVATLAEDMLTGGDDAARALVTIAGNPVLSTPNGRKLDEALAGLDFMLSIDLYINETTRHADLILPPTGPLEHDHYDIVFHQLAIRNTARYSPALFPPGDGALHDWEILLELAARLDGSPWLERLKGRALRWYLRRQGPTGLLERLLRNGPYAHTLDFRQVMSAPHGIDLGGLEPSLRERLKTPDRRIAAAPKQFIDDLDRLAASLRAEPGARDELVLISRRQPRSNNSWMHNYPRLMKGADRCCLQIHPDDARQRVLTDGALARVRSRAGEVVVPVEITDAMMPGVVCLPHGFGHDRDGVRLRVAEKHPGASVNDLTDELRVDLLSGNAALSGVPVTVESEQPQPRAQLA